MQILHHVFTFKSLDIFFLFLAVVCRIGPLLYPHWLLIRHFSCCLLKVLIVYFLRLRALTQGEISRLCFNFKVYISRLASMLCRGMVVTERMMISMLSECRSALLVIYFLITSLMELHLRSQVVARTETISLFGVCRALWGRSIWRIISRR